MGTVASSRCRDYSVRNPDMLPGYCRADPRFPGAAEAVQGGRHKACFVGRGRGCARLGAGLPTEKGDPAASQRRLVRGCPPSASGRRRLTRSSFLPGCAAGSGQTRRCAHTKGCAGLSAALLERTRP